MCVCVALAGGVWLWKFIIKLDHHHPGKEHGSRQKALLLYSVCALHTMHISQLGRHAEQ